MPLPDPARWAQLSLLLDDLLAQDETGRASALAALRTRDAGLADELQALLAADAAARAGGFLSGQPAAPRGAPAAADSPQASLAGHRLGAYTLLSPLGAGGAGAVWLARRTDGQYEGQVAIKLLHLALLGRAGAQRFAREGAILSRLTHPHIARLLDAGVAPGGQPYLVLEWVQGERIDDHCRSRQLGVQARLALFLDVVAAVAHAHSHLAVHRDIKPGNILVTADGQVKLLDFGIAKLLDSADTEAPATEITHQGGRALTPEWAAPEQLRGQAVTTATDVYTLGLLLHLLLTGRHATTPEGATTQQAMQATLLAEPLRPSRAALRGDSSVADLTPQRLARRLAGDLDNIVARCLRKSPTERYATVTALADDLRRHLAHEPVSARADTVAYVAGKFVLRHRGAVATGLVVMLSIMGGVLGTLTQAHRANQERDRAIEEREMATGVSDFFARMLRQSEGGDAGGVRKQLDLGRDLARTMVFRYPIAQAAVFQQLSARYAEIDDTANAIAMMDEAVRVVNTLDDPARRASNLVPLLCGRANLLDDQGRGTEGLQVLAQARALLDAGAANDVPVDAQGECGLIDSYIRSALGQHDAAVQAARSALQMLRDSGADLRALNGYTSGLDRALLLAGRHAEAWPLAEKLAKDSEATEGTNTMAALRRSSRLTHLKRVGGQPLQALALAERDLALMTSIMATADTDALTLYEHGSTLLELSRLPEAAAELQRSVDSARAHDDPLVLIRAQLALIRAWLASEKPTDLDKAQTLFQAEHAQWKAIADRQSPSTVEVWRTQALLVAAQGDLPAARASLERAAAFGQRLSGPEHPARLALELSQGDLALAAGDASAALSHAAQALAAAHRAALDPTRSADVGRALWLQARSEAALQQAGASATAGQALAQLLPMLGATHPLTRAAMQVSQATQAQAPVR
jgi:tetratricopeptide (TPR) repeat protein